MRRRGVHRHIAFCKRARLAVTLEKITRDPAASRARVRTAMNGVEKLQQRMIAAVRTALRP